MGRHTTEDRINQVRFLAEASDFLSIHATKRYALRNTIFISSDLKL